MREKILSHSFLSCYLWVGYMFVPDITILCRLRLLLLMGRKIIISVIILLFFQMKMHIFSWFRLKKREKKIIIVNIMSHILINVFLFIAFFFAFDNWEFYDCHLVLFSLCVFFLSHNESRNRCSHFVIKVKNM